MIALCLTTPRRRVYAEVPPTHAGLPPKLKLMSLKELNEALDAADQQRAIQAAHVHRDDVRLNAALLVLNVLLFAVNAWLIGSVWVRFW